MIRLSRRNLLQGAFGISVALPRLEALADGATTPPRRLMTVFTANGDHIARRFTTKSETGWVFDDMLSPFQPYRQNLLVLEGIDKFHGRLPDGQRADGHEQGGSSLAPWHSGSGSFPIGGTSDSIGYVLGPSIDKELGDLLTAQNSSLRFKHLYFRVGGNSSNIWNTHAHAGPVGTQSPLAAETNPFAAYTRIFAGVDPAAQQALQRRLAMRQSALDLVKGELSTLRAKVSASDRARLDLHAESIRQVERGLGSMLPVGGACSTLNFGATFDTQSDAKWREVGTLFFKLSAMAFACDLVRAINFNWSGNTSDRVYPELGLSDGHHTISHFSDEPSFAKIRSIKKLLFSASTVLLDELKALPEAGGTVFDNTLVMNWSELAQGDTHQNDKNLVVLAGGAQRYFRMGRYLDLSGVAKRSFSNLLVSCWNYMGFTDHDAWGAPELFPNGTGPMPGLI
jgi:Protein of unknown function (DUF1552)